MNKADSSEMSRVSPHRQAVGAPEQMDACPIMPTYGAPPVMFVKGEGCRLWDLHGKEYLDFLSGLAVVSLGHSHPAVAEAVAAQARKLQHVSNLFATEHNGEVARTLDRLITGGHQIGGQNWGGQHSGGEHQGGQHSSEQNWGEQHSRERHSGGQYSGGQHSGRGQVFFCNSGAEANEAALKLARRWAGHGRYKVISAFRSFHGRTLATLHATGQPEKHEIFQPLPEGFRHVPYGDIGELERAVDEQTAAVFLEPIMAEGGVIVPPEGYLGEVRSLCDERGLLMMLDEVQTGLGRTGKWFAHQHENGIGTRTDSGAGKNDSQAFSGTSDASQPSTPASSSTKNHSRAASGASELPPTEKDCQLEAKNDSGAVSVAAAAGTSNPDWRPDVVTMAKALGNGMPIGACWAKAEVAAAFRPGEHATTFGGQPLATAAARAVLATMEEMDAPAVAEQMGAKLRSQLEAMEEVAQVRGRGLLLASEMTPEALGDRPAAEIASQCLEAGLVVNAITPTAIRWAPPFVITEDDIAEAVGIFGRVLAG